MTTTTADDYFHQTMRFLYHAEYFLRRQLQPTDTESITGTGNVYDNGNVPYYAFGGDSSGSSEPNIFTTNGSTPPHETPAGYNIYNGNNNNNNMGHDMNDLNNNNYDASPATSSVGTSQQSRGRTVLTILYLCVLGLCFVVPVFYYFRLHCFEESARRELELDFTAALQESEQHREEHRAARRKYLEERRARIVQLFGPVRMILREANFPHLNDPENAPPPTTGPLNYFLPSDTIMKNVKDKLRSDESVTMASEDVFSPYTSEDDDEQDEHDDHNNDENDDHNDNEDEDEHELESGNENESNAENINSTKNGDHDVEVMERMEKGVLDKKSECENDDEGDTARDEGGADNNNNDEEENPTSKTADAPPPGEGMEKDKRQDTPYGDEDTYFIKIPVPGLPCNGSSLLDPTKPLTMDDMKDREMRLAPGLCSICLSNYKVGSDIVWSSNENCDHHFHANCIERWLLKQREGPLCPCCRQDFVVDPFDLLEEEGNNNANNNNDNGGVAAVFQWDPSYVDMDDSLIHNLDGPAFVGAPGEQQPSDDEGASIGTGGNSTDNHSGGGHAVVDLEEGQGRCSDTPGMDSDGSGQIELVASDGDIGERSSGEEEGESPSQFVRR